MPKDQGEIVANVEPNGPAARAGIQQGDVIMRINGQDVTAENTLSYIVANTPIGRPVPIELVRNGRRMTLNATVGERPVETALNSSRQQDSGERDTTPSAGEQAARQSLGITLSELTPDIRRQLRLSTDIQGVVIAGLSPNSDAARQGLQRGDVILRINHQPTTTATQAAAAVDAARRAGRDTVLVLFQRGAGPARYIGLKLVAQPAGGR